MRARQGGAQRGRARTYTQFPRAPPLSRCLSYLPVPVRIPTVDARHHVFAAAPLGRGEGRARRRKKTNAASGTTSRNGSPDDSGPIVPILHPLPRAAAVALGDAGPFVAGKQNALTQLNPSAHAPEAQGLAHTKCISSVDTQLRDSHCESA